MHEEDPTRIVVIDDHTLFAEALQLALEVSGFEVVRAGTDRVGTMTTALASSALLTRPDVAILDLDLGRAGDGSRLIAPMVANDVAVLVVTASDDRARWGRCVRLGAAGVVTKTAPLGDIVSAVADVRRGRPLMSPSQREELVALWRAEQTRRRHQLARFESLTRREREVLLELAHGRRIGEIATAAVVAESTVRSQVKSILAKLGVSSQLAAVSLVHETGWPDA